MSPKERSYQMKNDNMRPCADWEKKLAVAVSGTLSPAEREALDHHLEACSACTSVLAQYREMDILIRTALLPDRPLPIQENYTEEKTCIDLSSPLPVKDAFRNDVVRAVVVGINEYQDKIGRLHYAKNDAIEIKRVLES